MSAPGRARLRVRVQPRAARDEIVGERNGALVVRLSAPPVEGRANDALCGLLARRLRIGRRSVQVIRGARSRDKVVEITGIDAEALGRALNDLL